MRVAKQYLLENLGILPAKLPVPDLKQMLFAMDRQFS
jgi:hypothetical protein